MTDQKLIAGIFNDFLGLYTGKIQTGIRPLIEQYKNHPMLMGLLSNLDEAAKIQAPKAMKEIYSFYKEYRGRDLDDADWKELTEKARQICAGSVSYTHLMDSKIFQFSLHLRYVCSSLLMVLIPSTSFFS